MVEKDATFQSLLHLKYMGDTNQCDTKFYHPQEEDVLDEINTFAKIDRKTLRYDPVIGAITGNIDGQVAKEGGHIELHLCYKKVEGEGKEQEKFFDHPAEKGSFQLDL